MNIIWNYWPLFNCTGVHEQHTIGHCTTLLEFMYIILLNHCSTILEHHTIVYWNSWTSYYWPMHNCTGINDHTIGHWTTELLFWNSWTSYYCVLEFMNSIQLNTAQLCWNSWTLYNLPLHNCTEMNEHPLKLYWPLHNAHVVHNCIGIHDRTIGHWTSVLEFMNLLGGCSEAFSS